MEEFEDALIMADVGPEITDDILELVRKTVQSGGDIQNVLREELLSRLEQDVPLKAYSESKTTCYNGCRSQWEWKNNDNREVAHRFVQRDERFFWLQEIHLERVL